jgi:hypothetical protein
MRLIAFEGLDRSGKSTLRRAFAKHTKEKHFTIDRFTTTSRVFNLWYDRNNEEWSTFLGNFEYLLGGWGSSVTVVFIDTNPLTCIFRGAEYKDEELYIQRILFIEELIKLIKIGIKVVVLEPKTVEENVEELECIIKQLS